MVVQCIPATWLFARSTGGQHGVGRDCGVESRKERGAQRTKRLPIASAKWFTGHVAERNARIAGFGRWDVVAANARGNFEQSRGQVGESISPVLFEKLRTVTE